MPTTSTKPSSLDHPRAGTLVALALPIIGQNLVTYAVTLADKMMVGRLGEASINGLYMASVVQLVLQMLLWGVESAMAVLVSQYWGRRDTGRIRIVVAHCLRLVAIVGLVAGAVTTALPETILSFLTSSPEAAEEGARYLRVVSPSFLVFPVSMLLVGAMRAIEEVRIGLVNSIVALGLNAVLNWLLIYGHGGFPALGVAGAAWATVVARLVELAIVAGFVLRRDRRLGFRLRDLRLHDPDLARDLLRHGTPLVLGQVVWAVNKFSMRWIVGHFSPSSSAAVSIADDLDGLLWVGTVGLASAMGILTGKMIGAGAPLAAVKRHAWRMQAVFAGIGVLSALVVHFGGNAFVSFYRLTPETVDAARPFLAVLTVSVLGRSYQAPCLMGLVKAGGDTSFVFLNDTFWVFCWVLPSALVSRYVLHAPDWAVYACLLSDQVTKCFVAFVKINRFHWMRNLTRHGQVNSKI